MQRVEGSNAGGLVVKKGSKTRSRSVRQQVDDHLIQKAGVTLQAIVLAKMSHNLDPILTAMSQEC